MSLFLIFPFALFLLGALLSRFRGASYLLASVASLVSFVLGALALSGRTFAAEWKVVGIFSVGVRIDHLSALFLTIASISWLTISLGAHRAGRSMPQVRALSFNAAIAGMLLVLVASDIVTFLVGWEIMTIFAFLLLTERGEEPAKAFRFLAFGELSSMLLALGFAVLLARNGSLSLQLESTAPAAFLVLASLGAVVKMDVVPFHTWMRPAYERLPGFVAALMSVGVTLTGVYGLERLLSASAYLRWWTLLLALLGAFSAFWGALQSSVSRGLRAVPAYSTVEYNGMILCAVALSAIAGSGSSETLAYLARFAGAAGVVLALSHALAKSLFFLSLGDFADRTGITQLGEMRGAARTRLQAAGLITAALSFAAFPPLIGYAAEWMLLETAFQSYKMTAFSERFVASLSGVFIALAIGLAAFAMIRFLGYAVMGRRVPEANGEQRAHGRTTGSVVAQGALSLLVVGSAIALPALLLFFGYGSLLGGLLGVPKPLLLVSGSPIFGVVSPTMFALVMLVLCGIPLLLWARRRSRMRSVRAWSGGLPIAANEQFSSDAFAQILKFVMRGLFRTRELSEGARRTLVSRDVVETVYAKADNVATRIGGALGRIYMNGRVGWYVAYILAAFVVVLVLAAV